MDWTTPGNGRLLDWEFFYGSSSPAQVMIVATHTYGTGNGSCALYKVLCDSAT